MTYRDTDFKAGDLVFVGEPAPLTRKVVWSISSINTAAEGVAYATLRSGQTERSRIVPVSQLSRFRVTEAAL